MALPPEVDVRGDALGRVRAGLTFTFEQDAERCRDPERGPLTAYADGLEPLDEEDAGLLRGLVVLDDSRVVVGGKGLFVLDRIWRVRVFGNQLITADGAGRVAVSVRPRN